jgi:tetratricopeptide (TPR) repeat protein
VWRYWRNGEHIREGRQWLDRVVLSRAVAPEIRGQLLYSGAVLAATQDDAAAATRLGREALKLAEWMGDRPAAAQAHNILGVADMTVGRYAEAAEHLRFGLAVWQEFDRPPGMAIALGNLAKVALRLGDVAEANDHIDRCLDLERSAGNQRGVLLGLECLGEILTARGDVDGARSIATESLSLARELGDAFGEAMALHQLGQAAAAAGDRAEALRLSVTALERRHDVGDREDLAVSLDTVADLTRPDHPELAVRLLAASQALRQRFRLTTPPGLEPVRRATLAAARQVLGEREVARAWQSGRTTPLDLMVDAILDQLG